MVFVCVNVDCRYVIVTWQIYVQNNRTIHRTHISIGRDVCVCVCVCFQRNFTFIFLLFLLHNIYRDWYVINTNVPYTQAMGHLLVNIFHELTTDTALTTALAHQYVFWCAQRTTRSTLFIQRQTYDIQIYEKIL